MYKLRVAAGVDSAGEITRTHFGDSDAIVYAEISEQGVTITERSQNPLLAQGREEEHGDLMKLRTARDLLQEVDILVAGRMSPNFLKLRNQSGKMPVVSGLSLEQTLAYLSNNIVEVTAFFENPDNIYLRIN